MGFVAFGVHARARSELMMIMASTNEFDIAAISIVLPMVVAVVWIIAHHWRKHKVAAYNARLKQLMIERDMSADEIERVIRAEGKLDRHRIEC